jgi:hypothetical protein
LIEISSRKFIIFTEERETDSSLWNGEFPSEVEYKNIIGCDEM